MAGYRKRNADGPNSEDKALDLFAEMMIEKIEGIVIVTSAQKHYSFFITVFLDIQHLPIRKLF